jgi:hypothetical protein
MREKSRSGLKKDTSKFKHLTAPKCYIIPIEAKKNIQFQFFVPYTGAVFSVGFRLSYRFGVVGHKIS